MQKFLVVKSYKYIVLCRTKVVPIEMRETRCVIKQTLPGLKALMKKKSRYTLVQKSTDNQQ